MTENGLIQKVQKVRSLKKTDEKEVVDVFLILKLETQTIIAYVESDKLD